jgi:hypothetical protein
MDESIVTVLPEWRQAIRDFLAAGFEPGDVVPHDWLEAHFGMEAVDSEQAMTLAEFQGRQFVWLKNMDAFRTELLEKHQVFLSNVHAEGYRIVPPVEQTALAQDKFETEAKRAYRRAAVTLRNVKLCELTDEQRRENTDAIAKLSMLRGMHKAVEV